MSTRIYIDGYNWYHAIFKHYPEWKWVNIQTYCEQLRSREKVISVKMFSAMIDPDNLASDARQRQQRYFDALGTLPKVRVILGVFQKREVTCRANGCRYSFYEEKKTDVNIAVEMISDSLLDDCDRMCVISGDSDTQPAVEWISKNRPNIALTAYVPALPNEQAARRIDYYATKGMNVECKFLPLDIIKDHQLPAIVKLGNGKMSVRPHVWA